MPAFYGVLQHPLAFTFTKLAIPDVVHVQPSMFPDRRGYFLERYNRPEFIKGGIDLEVVQENLSQSSRNVLRGLHYQLGPRAQAKLVGAVQGEIFDVAVDIRVGSSTYGKWVGKKLSSSNQDMLYVPEGFAHGFCVTSDAAIVVYHVNAEYSRDMERGIRWNDPDIGVDWPIGSPIVSEKDAALPLLRDADNNFRISPR